MKTTFKPSIGRQTFLPIIAALTITTANANVNNVTNAKKSVSQTTENVAWDTFKKADKNNDNLLTFDEYLPTTKLLKDEKGFKKVETNESKNWKRIGLMTLFATLLAFVGVIKDIKNEEETKKENGN